MKRHQQAQGARLHGYTPSLYRLVDDEHGQILCAAVEVEGFFVEASHVEEQPVRLFGTSFSSAQAHATLDNVELQIVDVRNEVIGAYYIGRVEILDLSMSETLTGGTDVTASFLGLSYPFAYADDIWRRWAAAFPQETGGWCLYPVEVHESWLHVAQNAWFHSGHLATRYSDEKLYSIEGMDIQNIHSVYCALGEAINGPGGYFGSNLDSLADCLTPRWKGDSSFRINWRNFGTSEDRVGASELVAVLDVLKSSGVEVSSTRGGL